MPARNTALLWLALWTALLGLSLGSTMPYHGDEAYYMASAVGMVQSGDWSVPWFFGAPRFQKPILPYWLTAAGYHLLGIHLWSGRVPFLLLAVLTLWLTYRLALALGAGSGSGSVATRAQLSVLLLAASTLFIESSRVSMTDLPLTFFTVLSLLAFARALADPARAGRHHNVAALATGLALAAKGLLGLMPAAAFLAHLLSARPEGWQAQVARLLNPLRLAVAAVLGFGWHAWVYLEHRPVLLEQLAAESARNLGNGFAPMAGHLLFYLRVVLTYFLPFSLLAAWLVLRRRARPDPASRFLLVFLGVTLLALVLVAREHRARYLLPAFPALAVVAGDLLQRQGLGALSRRLAMGWGMAQVVVLVGYPLVSGDPLRLLIGHWRCGLQGSLASHGFSTRESAWGLALSGGGIGDDAAVADFVIVEATGLHAFPGHRLLLGARRLRIEWDGVWPRRSYRSYALIEPGPRRDGTATGP